MTKLPSTAPRIRIGLLLILFLTAPVMHGESAEKKPEQPAQDESAGISEVDANPNVPISIDRHFVPFPKSKLTMLSGKKEVEISTTPGTITIVLFVSSWCVECQEIIPLVNALRKKYEKLGLQVTYSYSYDTMKDSIGSASEFGILGQSALASPETIKTFLSPELPSLYMSDRKGWLSYRKLKVKREDIEALERKIALMFVL
jgi:thiol-disulfide isomerase/thioredoxin